MVYGFYHNLDMIECVNICDEHLRLLNYFSNIPDHQIYYHSPTYYQLYLGLPAFCHLGRGSEVPLWVQGFEGEFGFFDPIFAFGIGQQS